MLNANRKAPLIKQGWRREVGTGFSVDVQEGQNSDRTEGMNPEPGRSRWSSVMVREVPTGLNEGWKKKPVPLASPDSVTGCPVHRSPKTPVQLHGVQMEPEKVLLLGNYPNAEVARQYKMGQIYISINPRF